MNRRDFLKYMGVSSAAAAASTALAKLPETVPKIQLLEPKKIIIPTEDVMIFSGVISYTYTVNHNITIREAVGDARINVPTLGRRVGTLEVEAYGEDNDGKYSYGRTLPIIPERDLNSLQKVGFDTNETTPLDGRQFIVNQYSSSGSKDEFCIIKMECMEIGPHGVI